MKNLVSLFTIIVAFTSCIKEYGEVNPGDQPLANSEFDFHTIERIQIQVELFGFNQEPLTGIPVQIWSASPRAKGHVIFKGVTDMSGTLLANYSLPATLDSVIVEIVSPGFPNYLVVSREQLAGGIRIDNFQHDYQTLNSSKIPGQSYKDEVNASNGRIEIASFDALGTYDEQGVPDYLEAERRSVTAELLSFIDASLPEGKPVPTYHPRYLTDDAEVNLNIEATADVWMTFVHEGAGYRNVIGFYTYPTDTPPQSADDIAQIEIAFPNASFAGSGGGLSTGDQVLLGRFEQGTTIGFVLFANGWRSGSITAGSHQVYSNENLNPESTAAKRKHTVLLWDEINELFLIGFEDLNRDGNSDDDFNDAIIFIESNPVEAISLTNVRPIDKPLDSDNDGVNDTYDDFPFDPNVAYSYTYPAIDTYGTFAFEDQWPRLGDYDFNDLVVDYHYTLLADGQNRLHKLESEFVIQAVGAGFSNGFGVMLDIAPDAVAEVTGSRVGTDLYQFNPNGTEASQRNTVLIVTDNVHQGFEGNGFINTLPTLAYQVPDTIRVVTELNTPMALDAMGSAPFNPFLVINRDRGREVHLPGYTPTDLVNADFFGQEDDNSNPGLELYYRTDVGLPWAMNLPVQFNYPQEKTDIRMGYNHFNSWARSNGFSYMDWYEDKPAFRNTNHLYR